MTRFRRPRRLGVHLAPDRITAVAARGPAWRPRPEVVFDVALEPPDDEGWPALAAALAALRASPGAGPGAGPGAALVVDVALARPLAHAKVVQVPAPRARDVAALVRRNARRFFLLPPDAALADARPLPRGLVQQAPGPGRPALAVAAPERVVAAVLDAAAAAGVRVERVTAAPVAAAAALGALAPARVPPPRVLVLAADDRPGLPAELVVVRGATPLLAQPVDVPPAGADAADAEVVDAALDAWAAATARAAESFAGRLEDVAVFGLDTAAARDVRDALAPHVRYGARLRPRPEHALDGGALAAFGAALLGAGSPLLLPDRARRALARAAVRRTAWLAGAAAAQLAVAAGVYRWGLERELDAVAERRARIAPAVAQAVAARGDAARVQAAVAALAGAAERVPSRVALVAGLAEALPDSAFVVALTADSGRVQLEGLAPSAAPVVPALRAMDGVGAATFAAPIRRDEASGLERFDVALTAAPARAGGAP